MRTSAASQWYLASELRDRIRNSGVSIRVVDRTARAEFKLSRASCRHFADGERNLVVINNGHRHFVYVARNKSLKLRCICRLFAQELVLKNFVGIPQDRLLERLLELTLYNEENLR